MWPPLFNTTVNDHRYDPLNHHHHYQLFTNRGTQTVSWGVGHEDKPSTIPVE